MNISNDTYDLNVEFPFHMNQLWMKELHNSDEHYHWHSFFEITYIFSGRAICFVDGKRYVVETGDIVIFNMDEVHGWEMEEDIQLLVMTFSPSLITNHADFFDGEYLRFFGEKGRSFKNKLDSRYKNTHDIYLIMDSIWKEWKNDQIGKNLMIKAEVLKILTLLTRHFKGDNRNLKAIYEQRSQLKKLEQALKYIDAHFMGKITLEEISEIAYMSPNYFSSFFHKTMGEKFIDYLIRKRICMANELLNTTKQSVLEVAMSCGFNNMANFYKCYKRICNCVPRGEFGNGG